MISQCPPTALARNLALAYPPEAMPEAGGSKAVCWQKRFGDQCLRARVRPAVLQNKLSPFRVGSQLRGAVEAAEDDVLALASMQTFHPLGV